MRHRVLGFVGGLAIAITVGSLAWMPVSAQTTSARSAAPAGKNWTQPRTVDGQPDLQGVWNYATLTPLERPSELAGKAVFTDEEAAEYEKKHWHGATTIAVTTTRPGHRPSSTERRRPPTSREPTTSSGGTLETRSSAPSGPRS